MMEKEREREREREREKRGKGKVPRDDGGDEKKREKSCENVKKKYSQERVSERCREKERDISLYSIF